MFCDEMKVKANVSVRESKTQEQIEKEIESLKKEIKVCWRKLKRSIEGVHLPLHCLKH